MKNSMEFQPGTSLGRPSFCNNFAFTLEPGTSQGRPWFKIDRIRWSCKKMKKLKFSQKETRNQNSEWAKFLRMIFGNTQPFEIIFMNDSKSSIQIFKKHYIRPGTSLGRPGLTYQTGFYEFWVNPGRPRDVPGLI